MTTDGRRDRVPDLRLLVPAVVAWAAAAASLGWAPAIRLAVAAGALLLVLVATVVPAGGSGVAWSKVGDCAGGLAGGGRRRGSDSASRR